jgi:hypothetical protein
VTCSCWRHAPLPLCASPIVCKSYRCLAPCTPSFVCKLFCVHPPIYPKPLSTMIWANSSHVGPCPRGALLAAAASGRERHRRNHRTPCSYFSCILGHLVFPCGSLHIHLPTRWIGKLLSWRHVGALKAAQRFTARQVSCNVHRVSELLKTQSDARPPPSKLRRPRGDGSSRFS